MSASDLTIDIDVKDDLLRAQSVAIAVVMRLQNDFQLPTSWVRIRFSGNKGFHIIIPAIAFGGFTPSSELPKLFCSIVKEITKDFSDCVDWGIYYPVSLIRIENTINEKSGRYCIPITVDELNKYSIDQIQTLATSIRDLPLPDVNTMTAIPALVELKTECLLNLNRPIEHSDHLGMVEPPKAIKMQTVFKRCARMKDIQNMSMENKPIGHNERLNLGCVLSAFGKEGLDKVHDMLKDQAVYDRDKTEYYLESMVKNAYKPNLCDRICGHDNRCEAIKTIRRRSPIAFAYTYDPEIDGSQKKFIESYAVDTMVSHVNDVIYSVSDRMFYTYNEGVYHPIQDEDLKSQIEPMLHFYVSKQLITNTALNGVIERFKLRKEVRFEGEFDANPFMLNLKNGLLNLRTGDLVPHTPEVKSRIQLPVVYDSKATCPLFIQFLDQIFQRKYEVIDYVLKMIAYFLIPSYTLHKVYVWYGIGRNGKGRLARVVENLLGAKNVAHEDIHDLAKERFATINLLGKLVNFSSELKTDDLDMAVIKKLSGEDIVSSDVKYKDKVSFDNKARLVILANDLPRFSEIGQAVMQRFEFISFTQSFLGSDADTTLDSKLQSELSGIFNLVLTKIPEIMDADGAIHFDAPKAVRTMKETLISETSTVVEFVKECCKPNPKTEILLSTFYREYNIWTKECGYRPLGKKNVSKVLRETLGLRVDNNSRTNDVTIFGLEPTTPLFGFRNSYGS
ncbi:MAG: phage/plasmid primase, P4 family [Bacteroidota bacterium]